MPQVQQPHRTAISIGILAVAGALVGWFLFARTTRPKNVILIVVDTLRADHLGCYGMPVPLSPAIDRFASQSVVFDRCISPASWTKPSVASLFTSLYPSRHGIINTPWPTNPDRPMANELLPQEAETLAETMTLSGYETTAIVSNDWLRPTYGFDQGFSSYTWLLREKVPAAANTWLRQQKGNDPFFLYLHFMDVHGPYIFNRQDWNALKNEEKLGPDRPMTNEEKKKISPYFGLVNKEEISIRAWRAAYAAGIRQFDRRFELLWKTLEKTGRLKDSLVILTADHGEQLLEHGGLSHGWSLYREEIHIPLIIYAPGLKPRRIQQTVSLVDVMPTILGLIGKPKSDSWDGGDLSQLVRGGQEIAESKALSGWLVSKHPSFSVVEGRKNQAFHLIEHGKNGDHELYSWNDSGETTNLVQRRPKLAQSLAARLRTWREELAARPTLATMKKNLDKEMIEGLRSLGYLQ